MLPCFRAQRGREREPQPAGAWPSSTGPSCSVTSVGAVPGARGQPLRRRWEPCVCPGSGPQGCRGEAAPGPPPLARRAEAAGPACRPSPAPSRHSHGSRRGPFSLAEKRSVVRWPCVLRIAGSFNLDAEGRGALVPDGETEAGRGWAVFPTLCERLRTGPSRTAARPGQRGSSRTVWTTAYFCDL